MEQTKLTIIQNAVEDKKCENIEIIDVSEKSPFFTHIIVATIQNSRMANAVGDEIQKKLALINETINHIEGRDTSWVLIDCYDIIVHLFTEEERQRVNLEALYTIKAK